MTAGAPGPDRAVRRQGRAGLIAAGDLQRTVDRAAGRRMLTCTGTVTCGPESGLTVPLPICPNWFMPHAQMVPSDLTASVK
jgi:hypothetical protein